MLRQMLIFLVCLFVALANADVATAQGLYLPGAGAVSRSFGGATTAAPLDAAGALLWNPAAMSALPNSEVMFGSEFLISDTHVSSTVPAGSFGGFPPTTRSGTTRSDSGVSALPTIALVYKPEESPFTYGVGVLSAVGGSVNFPGSDSNPILTPQNPPGGGGTPPFTLGFGPQAASLALFSTTPNVSMQVTDRLVVGVGAAVDTMLLSIDPAFFGPRNANGTFPAATHSRPFWGAGFRVGALYSTPSCWDFGFSYNSPRWYETFRFNSSDEFGNAQELELALTLPQIYSLGTAYRGIPRTVLAVDVRYFDYQRTKLFGESVVDGGVDWSSIWAAAVGAQYQVSQTMTARIGYSYGENPVPDVATLFNTQIPGIIKHTIGVGATQRLTKNISASLAYVHGFRSEISGPILQIPGTNVALDSEYDSILFSVHVNF